MAVTITNTASAIDATDQTTYTFASQSLGAADAERIIAVFASVSGTAPSLSSITIAGQTASTIETQGGGGRRIWLVSADVPTGTSGDVVVTLGEANTACGIGVYSIVGSPGVFQSAGDATEPNPSISLDVPANGAAVGGILTLNTSTFAWTGLTEDYDAVVEAAGLSHSGASDEFVTEQTALSITVTPSDTTATNNPVFVAASFGPLVEGAGSASGQGTATAVGASTNAAAGDAGGFALVQAVGEARVFAEGVGVAAGQATVRGFLESLLITTTRILQKPVDFWLPEQERLTPKSPNAVSKRILRRIFRE